MNLGVLIDGALTRFRERPAVSDDNRSLTYEDVGDRIMKLGSGLSNVGFGHQSRIASLQRNSIEAIETDIMSARFGFCRTHLNAKSNAEDHVYSLNQCEASVLIFGEEFAAHVDSLRDRLETVRLYICTGAGPSWAQSYSEIIESAASYPPRWDVEEDDLHSIYFTSGSTGKPKGVALSQKNWLVHVRNHLLDPFRHIKETDVCLHAAPISHASGCMIFPHFVRGAAQHVIQKFDPDVVFDLIENEGVTTTFLAPTMIHMMLDAEGSAARDTSSLHTVLYGGAPMSAERIRETIKSWGPVLLQGYGQWETPQMSTYLSREDHVRALEEPDKLHRLTSCGRPLSFVNVATMDDAGSLLEDGAEGEIVVSGDLLMVGYLNNQKATDSIRVGQWQRTGDVGRIDKDGFVYLTDRKKDVIITGGSNVYPREVEEIIYTHPNVGEAIAIGVPDDKWGETVHVVLSPRKGCSLEPNEFLNWCQDRFGSDKRPRSASVVESLPKSAYGKILRRQIRDEFWRGRDRRI